MIIGITGMIGAGKGTVVEYLVGEKGFRHFSARKLIQEELVKRGLPVDRDSMLTLSNEWRAMSSGYIPTTLIKRAIEYGGDAVVESLRSVNEIKTLREYPGTYLFAVDADPKIRFERVLLRKSVTDNISYETFLEQEERENSSNDPDVANLRKCIHLADYAFINNGTKEELFTQVEQTLAEIKKTA